MHSPASRDRQGAKGGGRHRDRAQKRGTQKNQLASTGDKLNQSPTRLTQ